MRPRRYSGRLVRPLNFTVRGHLMPSRVQRLVPLLAVWVVLSLVFAGGQLLFSWPWRPHSSLGWTLLLVGTLPLWLLGEYVADRLIYRSRLGVRLDALGPGAGPSTLRIVYVLLCFLVFCAAVVLVVAPLGKTGWLSAL